MRLSRFSGRSLGDDKDEIQLDEELDDKNRWKMENRYSTTLMAGNYGDDEISSAC
jgi:hypothetical protein